MIHLACPACNTTLPDTAGSSTSLECPSCSRAYPVVNGVVRFAAEDPFYLNEDRWSSPDMSTGGAKNLLIRKQRFFVERLKDRTGTLLDLGCGGGWALFARGREVAGLDIAQRSLEAAGTIYSRVVAAGWTHLPFPDGSFDTVVSSDVLGHVPFADKEQVFSELFRVLKPGGRTLHYIEAEGTDPVTRMAKSDRDLYQQNFVAPEGHIGMEAPTAIFARFRSAGFRPVAELGAYKVLVYVNRAVQLYGSGYEDRSRILRAWTGAARLAMKSPALETAGNLVMAAGMEIGDRVLPHDWGSGALVEYEKPGRSD
jgi:SAM-dependent methyltransferase